jgi:predicted O-methyltransferase YrrM
MLLSGRVFSEAEQSPSATAVRELTRLLTTDPAWTTSLLPIRDGLIVAQKSK